MTAPDRCPRLVRPARAGLLLLGLLAAGCATPAQRAGLDPAIETAIRGYYEAHATEYESGPCLAPYIDAITRAQVIADDGERLTVEVRYLFRDWRRNDGGERSRQRCFGYGDRQFSLARNASGVEVIEMSGPRRR